MAGGKLLRTYVGRNGVPVKVEVGGRGVFVDFLEMARV